MLVGPYGLEHMQAADLGHFVVKQNQNGVAGGAGAEFAAALEIIQRFGAVVDDDNLAGQSISRQRGEGQFDVARVVFDEEDFLDDF